MQTGGARLPLGDNLSHGLEPSRRLRGERAVLGRFPCCVVALGAPGARVVSVAGTAVSVAGAAVGSAAVSVGGAVVGSTVKVAGKAVEKTVDVAVARRPAAEMTSASTTDDQHPFHRRRKRRSRQIADGARPRPVPDRPASSPSSASTPTARTAR